MTTLILGQAALLVGTGKSTLSRAVNAWGKHDRRDYKGYYGTFQRVGAARRAAQRPAEASPRDARNDGCDLGDLLCVLVADVRVLVGYRNEASHAHTHLPRERHVWSDGGAMKLVPSRC